MTTYFQPEFIHRFALVIIVSVTLLLLPALPSLLDDVATPSVDTLMLIADNHGQSTG